jgi:hypothetical protein
VSHAHRHVNVARMAGPGDWWTPPDDDGLVDCPMCDARGWVMALHDDGTAVRIVCEACEGERYLDESGYPYKPQEEA